MSASVIVHRLKEDFAVLLEDKNTFETHKKFTKVKVSSRIDQTTERFLQVRIFMCKILSFDND